MLKFIFPIFFLFCACQTFGIKDSDTIAEAEMKVIHGLETEAGVIINKSPAPAK